MVLHVAYSGVGGTGSFVGDLCPRLGNHKGQPTQVIFYGFEPLHSGYGERLTNAGIAYSAIRKRRGLDISSLRALSSAIRRASPDIVLMHGGGTAWIWPLLRIMGVRARLVLVEHGPEVSWGYLRHVISVASSVAVIAISHPLAASLRARFGFFFRSRPLYSIPNGIDTEYFGPSAAVRSPNTVLNAATLSPFKDQATLIRACALIAKHRAVQLILAGDGVMRAELQQLAVECGIQENTTFLGSIGREELVGFYHQASVFVLSTKGEGISLAMLEAMSCGLPIVASDVPGVKEILAGNDCAILVPQGHAEEMAQAIIGILQAPEVGTRMGEAAREYVRNDYSVESMAARYREVLDKF